MAPRLHLVLVAWILLSAAASCTGAPPSETTSAPYTCETHRTEKFAALYRTESFAGYGLAQEQSANEVIALRCLMEEPDAKSLLRDLQDHGTIAGQLYALVGLAVLDQTELRRSLDRYKTDGTQVRIFGGDILTYFSAADIAAGIGRGHYVREILPDHAPDLPESGVEMERQ